MYKWSDHHLINDLGSFIQDARFPVFISGLKHNTAINLCACVCIVTLLWEPGFTCRLISESVSPTQMGCWGSDSWSIEQLHDSRSSQTHLPITGTGTGTKAGLGPASRQYSRRLRSECGCCWSSPAGFWSPEWPASPQTCPPSPPDVSL